MRTYRVFGGTFFRFSCGLSKLANPKEDVKSNDKWKLVTIPGAEPVEGCKLDYIIRDNEDGTHLLVFYKGGDIVRSLNAIPEI